MVKNLDLTHLRCPFVVLALREALAPMAAGADVMVIAADPLAAIDIPLFAMKAGHACTTAGEGRLRFHIVKGGG